MVTYDEGDYEGGQEDGRPQGEGKMTYSETDPLGRLVTTIHIGQGWLSFLVVVATLSFFRLSYEGNWEAGQPSGQGCMKFRWSNIDIDGLPCPEFFDNLSQVWWQLFWVFSAEPSTWPGGDTQTLTVTQCQPIQKDMSLINF